MALLHRLVLLGLYSVTLGAELHKTYHRHLAATETQCEYFEFSDLEPTVTRAPVIDLEWVGDNDQTVFAITRQPQKNNSLGGGFWRSKNGGVQFSDMTANLNETSGAAESFVIMALFSQKSKPENVLVMGTGSYNWISNNYGETFTAVRNPGGVKGSLISETRVHPRASRDNWILVLLRRPGCKSMDRATSPTECPMDLMVNKDAYNPKSTWENLTANANGKITGFEDFDWGASLCPSGDCTDLHSTAISDELILATVFNTPGDNKPATWNKDLSFVTSTDFFQSYTTRVRCGNEFEVVGRSVYLAMSNMCPTEPDGSPRPATEYPEGITLYTSMDAGSSFTQACLPMAPDQLAYQLMVTHDGRGAVIVVKYGIDSGFTAMTASSIYTAGPHHALYALSLTNVLNPDWGSSADFARVAGIPGIYIANQMLPFAPGDPSTQLPGSMGDDSVYYYDSLYGDYDLEDLMEKPLVETRITFNGGGRWQRIPAPTSFRHASCNLCKEGSACYLHLHSLSEWDSRSPVPAVYSNPSAPGLVMASGNVAPLGLGLDKEAGLCTFLSRDGGVTWEDVRPGAYIYEFADWGGIIVMARHPGQAVSGPEAVAEEVLFSLDYGKCWQRVGLKVPMLVDNIVIEPDGQRAWVIVHGRACKNSTSPKCAAVNSTNGLMYVLDVERLMRDKSWGDCAPTDYETWVVPQSAKEPNQPRCVLGEQLTLVRRKQDSRCFQGGDYKRPEPQTNPCNCAKDQDTECEYGYIRSNGTCVPVDKENMPRCPVIETGTYTVSETRRRLVHGDKCLNPSAIIPDTGGTGKKTDANGGGGGGGGGGKAKARGGGWIAFLVVVLVLAVLGGLFAAWWHFRATEDQQDTVREVAGSAAANVAAAWGLLVDKISNLVSSIRNRGSTGLALNGEELGYFQPLGDPGYDMEGRGNVFTLK